MDDRFDFQLISSELLDGIGLDLIPNTYRTLGNDGNHFDMAINVPPTPTTPTTSPSPMT